jgi:serine/threonine protein kinase
MTGRLGKLKPETLSVPSGVSPMQTRPGISDSGDSSSGLPNLPPELLAHPGYRVERMLGQGGMGTVYLAADTRLGRQVALKVLRRDLLRDDGARARFLREARVTAALNHPNFVGTHDLVQAGSLTFVVMEYVDGIDLGSYLKHHGPLPIGLACDLVKQVAEGLQHLHEKGLVHRDIKPSNLMVTKEGGLKILDFGLARLSQGDLRREELTVTGTILGTPEYMAPEQARDPRAADIRADIYSLGATLYCLLTGRPPFQAERSLDLVLAHMQTAPERLHRLRPEIPKALSALVDRMLAKDPIRRPLPQEAAKALEPFCRKEGPGWSELHQAPSRPEQASRAGSCALSSPTVPPTECRREDRASAAHRPSHRWFVTALLVASLVVVGGFVFSDSGRRTASYVASLILKNDPPESRPSSSDYLPYFLLFFTPVLSVAVAVVVVRVRLGWAWNSGRGSAPTPVRGAPAAAPAGSKQQTRLRKGKPRHRLLCHGCEVPITAAQVKKRRELGFDWILCPGCGVRVELKQPVSATTVKTLIARVEELEGLLASRQSAPPAQSDTPTDDRRTRAQTLLQNKITCGEFDAFLAHNNKDKAAVQVVADRLKERGLYPWLDVEQIPPGRPFLDEIQNGLAKARTMLIFIGPAGVGRWEVVEMRTSINQCIEKGGAVIPVLLPGVAGLPKDLLFLAQFHFVRFQDSPDEPDVLDALEWGITGKKPVPGTTSIP